MGTEGDSLSQVFILDSVISIALDYKYPAAILVSFLTDGSPSRSIEGIGYGGITLKSGNVLTFSFSQTKASVAQLTA